MSKSPDEPMMPRNETLPAVEAAHSTPDVDVAPPMPSQDQPFYEESLRAAVRSIGRLIQGRRKTER